MPRIIRRLGWAVPVLAIAFPLLRLWPLNAQYYADWPNHWWLAAFQGEYLRQHGSIPVVLNTPEQAGIPFPLFYGYLFYPLAALLTAWCNPDLALRIIVIAVTALQFLLVSKALESLAAPPWTARAAASLVIWATYPLTNLYNRTAVPEFVATGLLTCAVSIWVLMVQAPPEARWRRAAELGLVFALMAGTHPITLLYSLPVMGLLLVITVVEHRHDRAFCRSLVEVLALPTALVVLSVAPWIYALARFRSHLRITSISSAVWFFPGIDDWKTRFSLIPFDPRTSTAPVASVSTPYLDAQINVALAALVIGWLATVAGRGRRAALLAVAPFAATFAFFTWISLCPSSFDFLPKFARMIQFAYRAITYENLACLLAFFALAKALQRSGARAGKPARRARVAITVAALALAATGVVIKWQHATSIISLKGAPRLLSSETERRGWASLPPEFSPGPDYVTPTLYTALDASEQVGQGRVTIPVGSEGTSFGAPQPVVIGVAKDAWFTTNVLAFPWNRIVVDGTVVRRQDLRIDGYKLAVRVPAGVHRLELRTVADPAWLVLRFISFGLVSLWLGWAIFTTARDAYAGRRRQPSEALRTTTD